MNKIVEKSCYCCRLSPVDEKMTCTIVAASIEDAASIFRVVHDAEPYMISKLGNVYCYE